MHSTEAIALSETGPSTLTDSRLTTSDRHVGSKDHKPLPRKTPTEAKPSKAATEDIGKRVGFLPRYSRETFLKVECEICQRETNRALVT